MRWLQVFVQRLRFGGRAAPGAEVIDPDDADMVAFREGQHVAGVDGVMGLFVDGPVDAELAAGAEFAGQRAAFEKPRIPQPLIQALALHGHAAFECFEAAAGAASSA